MKLPRYTGKYIKHYAWELEHLQNLPLDLKVKRSIKRIKEWYEAFNGKVHVSFSGGKDSTVLLHLVRSVYPDVKGVFADTGLEYPEIREFVNEQDNIDIIKPKKNFRQVILEHGYPVVSKETAHKIEYARRGNESALKCFDLTIQDVAGGKSRFRVPESWHYLLDAPFKISDYCCFLMKKSPFYIYETQTRSKPFLGTLACESKLRKAAWQKTGCNSFEGRHNKSTPMSFWTENDVLQYIVDNDIEICSLYGDIIKTRRTIDYSGNKVPEYQLTGLHRTGCMFCMFGCHREDHPNRFERMKETHPKQYEWCMKPIDEGGLGLDFVLNYLKVEH